MVEGMAQPPLLFLDDLHLVVGGAGALLGMLSRYLRRGRVFAAARAEIDLPVDAPVPVVVRLPPLSPVEAGQLATALVHRLGVRVEISDALLRRCGGNPQLIRRALQTGTGTGGSSAEAAGPDVGELSDVQRRALLLLCVTAGRGTLSLSDLQALSPPDPTVGEQVQALSRRFLVHIDRDTVTLPDSLRDALIDLLGVTAAGQQAARRDVAELLLARFRGSPARHFSDGVAAIQLLLQDRSGAEPLAKLQQMVRSLIVLVPGSALTGQLLGPLSQLREALRQADDLSFDPDLATAGPMERLGSIDPIDATQRSEALRDTPVDPARSPRGVALGVAAGATEMAGHHALQVQGDLLAARLFLHAGDIAGAYAILGPLFDAQDGGAAGADDGGGAGALPPTERLHLLRLLSAVYGRMGRWADAQRLLSAARPLAKTATERLHLTLLSAQHAALSGGLAQATALLHDVESGPPQGDPMNRLRVARLRALIDNLADCGAVVVAAAAPADGIVSHSLPMRPLARVAQGRDGGAGPLCPWLSLQQLWSLLAGDDVAAARTLLNQLLHQAAALGPVGKESAKGAAKSATALAAAGGKEAAPDGGKDARSPLLSFLRGLVGLAEGDLTAARAALHDALTAFEASQDAPLSAFAAQQLGVVLVHLGDATGARGVAARALSWARTAAVPVLLQAAHLLSARVRLLSMDLQGARLHLAQVAESTPPRTSIYAIWAADAMATIATLETLRGAGIGRCDKAVRERADVAALHGTSGAAGLSARLHAHQALLTLLWGERLCLCSDLSERELDDAIARLEQIGAHYRSCGRAVHATRASLALGWLLLRRGQDSDLLTVDALLAAAQTLCTRHAYGALHLRCLLLEAALGRRQGHVRRALQTLRQGLDCLGDLADSVDGLLLRAAYRDAHPASVSDGGPDGDAEPASPQVRAILTRLGLCSQMPYEIVDRGGVRDASEEEREQALQGRALIVDLERGVIARGLSAGPAADRALIAGRPLMATLLAALLLSGEEGASAERLFHEVWGGRNYHPLQHRNTIYVAIGRLRHALRDLLPGREVVETTPGGWRLHPDVDICVLRRKGRTSSLSGSAPGGSGGAGGPEAGYSGV